MAMHPIFKQALRGIAPEAQKLTVTRLVTAEECHWLDRDFEAGETVYAFHGSTYGCIGPNGRAVSLEPDTNPFFELPTDALVDEAQSKAAK